MKKSENAGHCAQVTVIKPQDDNVLGVLGGRVGVRVVLHGRPRVHHPHRHVLVGRRRRLRTCGQRLGGAHICCRIRLVAARGARHSVRVVCQRVGWRVGHARALLQFVHRIVHALLLAVTSVTHAVSVTVKTNMVLDQISLSKIENGYIVFCTYRFIRKRRR